MIWHADGTGAQQMQIVDIIQDSFQEYEDKQSLVLFSKGCNFECSGCYNLHVIEESPVKGTAIEMVEKYITPLHEAVVFLGGEPTIWGDRLIEAARHVKGKGLAVKVFTNGFLPDVIRRLNQHNLVDAYSVDFKCIHGCAEVIGRNIRDRIYLAAVMETIDEIRNSNLPLELRTTAWDTVQNMDGLKAFVAEHFPGVPHIIQSDFRELMPAAV